MKCPLVIAYGNSLREDDGLALRAAQLLDQAMPPAAAKILATRQLTPELAAELVGVPLVIFLDAALDLEPGVVVAKRVSPQKQTAWSHELSPGQLTGLAEALNGAVPLAFHVLGGVSQAGFGESLTPVGELSARRVAEAALEILRRDSGAASGSATHPDPGRVQSLAG